MNTFAVQDTINNSTLTEVMDNDAEPQVLRYGNLGLSENYKINNLDSFKPLDEDTKNEKHI